MSDNVHDSPSSAPTYEAATALETNTICFIDNLPTEILEVIFIHCACDYFYHHDGSFVPAAPDWVHVSYVSRRWRDVAINCPSLWTYLFINSPRWMEESLARSKQASLKLNMRVYHSSTEKFRGSRFLEQVIHSDRIAELFVYIPPGFSSHHTLFKLSASLSRLRILKIECDRFCRPLISIDGDTTALEALHVEDCSLAWYSLNLSHLRALYLFGIDRQFQQNMSGLLTTLGQMPNLERLCCFQAVQSAEDFLTSTAFHTLQKIELNHLSLLDMSAPLSSIIAFLSCVCIPSKARVELSWSTSVPRYFGMFTSLIAQRLAISEDHKLQIPLIRTLDVIFTGSFDWIILFGTSERDCSSSHNVTLRLDIPFYPAIFRDIPLSNVQSLFINTYGNQPFEFLKCLLEYLPNLRHLKLCEVYISGLPSLLSVIPRQTTRNANNHDEEDEGPDQMLVPALEELELEEMGFDVDVGESLDPFGHNAIGSLCNALATRKGVRGRLTMTRCTTDIGDKTGFDMTGWWGDGHFHVSTKRVFTPVKFWEVDSWLHSTEDDITTTMLGIRGYVGCLQQRWSGLSIGMRRIFKLRRNANNGGRMAKGLSV